MAITVISRPQGHKLDTEQFSAVITDDGTGTAVVYVAGGHGMQDGDWVYIESNFDRYNGYKYVDSTAYDHFEIKNSSEEAPIEFIQEADITFYRSVLNHGFCCVHLPIVYELESSLYPTNTEEEDYTPRTVVSQANNSGYTQLNLSSALGVTNALDWIELVGDGDLSGPYQIIEVLNQWSVVIDLAYNASNVFTGYQVVNYYNNYHVKVQVYAGLTSDHPWEDQKPYELAATLEFIPDSNNRVKFSISEILKGYIETRNNLTLDTLPNNLDFYVQFYISYSENYDSSDGETITINEGSYTSDQSDFEGHALNAKLPFKSIDAGFLSEYIDDGEGANLAQWLVLQDTPVLIIGYFFDLSFINQNNQANILITIYKSLNGIVTDTEEIELTQPGSGVIRVPIVPEAGFDQYCVQAAAMSRIVQELIGNEFDLSLFLNGSGNGNPWTLGENPYYSNSDGSVLLYIPYPVLNGAVIQINYDFTVVSMESGFNVHFCLTNSLLSIQDNTAVPVSSIGQKTGSVNVTATENKAYFAVFVSGPGIEKHVILNNLSEGTPQMQNVTIPGYTITEQICLKVTDECNTYSE